MNSRENRERAERRVKVASNGWVTRGDGSRIEIAETEEDVRERRKERGKERKRGEGDELREKTRTGWAERTRGRMKGRLLATTYWSPILFLLLHIRRTLFLLSPSLSLSLTRARARFLSPFARCALTLPLHLAANLPPRGRRTRESAPIATLPRPCTSSCTSASSDSLLVSPHRARECKPPLPPIYYLPIYLPTYTDDSDALLTGNVSFRAVPFLFRDGADGRPLSFLHAGARRDRSRGVVF